MIKEMEPKFPQVRVNLKASKGNMNEIVTYVANRMLQEHVSLDEVNDYTNLAQSGSFVNLLLVTMNYVTLADDELSPEPPVVLPIKTKGITREQQAAIFNLYNRYLDAFMKNMIEPETPMSYLQFRRGAHVGLAMGGCLMIKLWNMWFGIEPDGHTHT